MASRRMVIGNDGKCFILVLWHNNVFYLWVDNKGNDNVVDRMTEKRFKVVQGYNDRYCQDTATNKLLNQNQTVDVLNEYAEENEQLKQSYKEFEDECQSTFNAMNRKQDDLYRKNFKLKEENERLRRCINEIYTIARLEEV